MEALNEQQKISEEKFHSYKSDFQTKIKSTSLSIEDFKPIENISEQINSLKKEKSKIILEKDLVEKQREATSRGLGTTKGRIEDAESKKKKMVKNFSSKMNSTNIAICPTCQKELTKEHYEEMVLQFNNDIKINQEKIITIIKRLDMLSEEVKQHQNKLDSVKERILIMQSLKTDYENYQKYELKLSKDNEELNTFLMKNKTKFQNHSPDNVKQLSKEREKLNTELEGIKKAFKDKQERFEKNENEKINLKDEITRMKELDKSIGELEIEIDHINKAKEFVRRFVTEYMVVKRLVKNIALTTNKYIKDFTSGQYSDLILDLTGTRKTGLSLKIKDNFNGVHESIEVLSGGDKTALGMALRLAISELMSKIRPIKESPKKNPKIDILLLDEPLAALDAIRRERILKHLIKSKTFSQIFLITHTDIPSDINTHKIFVSKDHSTGISTATFKRETKKISPLLNP